MTVCLGSKVEMQNSFKIRWSMALSCLIDSSSNYRGQNRMADIGVLTPIFQTPIFQRPFLAGAFCFGRYNLH